MKSLTRIIENIRYSCMSKNVLAPQPDVRTSEEYTNMTYNEPDAVLASEPDVDRRSMFGRVGLRAAMGAVAGVAGLATAASTTPAEAQTAALTDGDILNFALNLEYVEAAFYLRAATGQGLAATDVTGTGTQGGVTGGSAVPFRSPAIQQYAQVLASDEQAHVRFIRAAIVANGGTPVARPTIDLATSFTTLALAAGLIVPGQTFNPFADDVSFLLGAYIFEDVGVTAYAGAARLITNKNYLEAASAILAVEAYHAGAIRTLLANIGAGVAANAISALRQTLGTVTDQGIIIPGESYNFASSDSNGLVFRRTPTQVLNIVYGNTTGTPGLFFPNGLNGTIK